MNWPINRRLRSLLALLWVFAPATIWRTIVLLEITISILSMIKEELTRVFIVFTRENFTMCVSSVWILFASFTEPSVFRMVEVSPKVFGFPFAIDRWLFLGNKFFSRFYGSLHFISLKNSVVIIRIFIFFIFNFNSWCTSKLFFYNVNISTFFRRFFEMLIIDDVPVTGRTVDVDAWSRPTVKYDWTFILSFTWCLRSSTRHFIFTEACVLFWF